MSPHDLLDTTAVAALLGVRPQTVHQTRWRQRMPEPDVTVSGHPAWRRGTIVAWAHRTGRTLHRTPRDPDGGGVKKEVEISGFDDLDDVRPRRRRR